MRNHTRLAVILAIQAILLFSALDRLAIWGDELFTLQTVARPASEIIPILQHDIHPPLYYLLLHAWPWHELAGLRAFSAMWALVATVIFYLLWTRRWTAITLLALSPCFLLYGRMARSYSMQTALTLLALGLLWRRKWLLAGIATLALLYTHYVPGVAVLAAFVLVTRTRASLLFAATMALGYLPWIFTLAGALRKWGEASGFSSQYKITGNALAEQVVKIGFGVVSLTIGETFTGLSLVLVPVILWLAWRGLRDAPRSLVTLGVAAAVIGYLGVSRWVSYPFIPARLLWLLPFGALAVARGAGKRPFPLAAIGLSFGVSIALYFAQDGFLNQAYAAPHREVADRLNRDARPDDLILADGVNTDPESLRYYLSGRTPLVVIDESVRPRLASVNTVWIYANTRDTSPGHITSSVRAQVCEGAQSESWLLRPYPEWQKMAMQGVGIRPPLTHAYELRKCTAGDRRTDPPRVTQ